MTLASGRPAVSTEPHVSATPITNDLVAGLILAMQAAGMAISMSALIFSGPLAAGLPRAIAAFTVALGAATIFVGLRTGIVPVALITQDAPTIVLVAVTAQLVGSSGSSRVSDVFVVLVLSTLLAGIGMWLLGRFGLGRLVRFLPTTVIGAFMAGTGWLLFKGGAEVATGVAVGWPDVGQLAVGGLAKFWIPAVAFGIAMSLIGRSKRVPPIVIGILGLASMCGFYAITLTTSSVRQAEDGGWLIGPFPTTESVRPVSITEVTNADWTSIAGTTGGLVSVVGVALVAVLLNLTGIGTDSNDRVDIDHELRVMGTANIAVAPLGTAPPFFALGDTILLNRLGASRRATTIATGVGLLVLGFVGVTAIGYIPRFLVAGLLTGVGLSLLSSWAANLVRSTSRLEQCLSVAIVIAIASLGVLTGIAVGIVAACGVFIVRYSRTDPFRMARSGREMRSRVDRSAAHRSMLNQFGERLRVFELQGYLFFGSVAAIEERLEATSSSAATTVPDVIIIDFKHVTGIDVSAHSLISKIAAEHSTRGTTVVLSAIDDRLLSALAATTPSLTSDVQAFATLDEALELGEELLIERAGDDTAEKGPKVSFSEALEAGFVPIEYEPGAVVMGQDEVADGMLVVTRGQFTAFQVDQSGNRRRLRRFGPVTVVGEIGMIEGVRRTAEIVADTDAAGLWLPATRYQQLRVENPELIIELHEFMLSVQAARVIELSDALTQSMR